MNMLSLPLRASCQRGASKITLLVFGALVAAAVFVGYHVLPFYYCYYEIQNHMLQMVKVASMVTDEEMRDRIWQHIKQLGLPVEPDDLKIIREDGVITISLDYYEVFFVTWKKRDYDLHTFHFLAQAKGEIPRT